MRIHGNVVVKPPFALGFAKPEGIPGEEATPNATPSTRSIKPSAFQTSVDARHAGALIAARYATGSAVTPISASSQPVNEKGVGYRVKHEMLDDLPPARTRKSVGPNAFLRKSYRQLIGRCDPLLQLLSERNRVSRV